MNFKKIVRVGLKIVAAAVAGLAAFMGLDEILTKKVHKEGGSTSYSPLGNGSGPLSDLPPVPPKPQDEYVEMGTGAAVIEGLRKTQGMAMKVMTVIQTLTSVTETMVGLFGKGNSQPLLGGFYQQPNFCGSRSTSSPTLPCYEPFSPTKGFGRYAIGQKIDAGNGNYFIKTDDNMVELY